jgi:predicted transcriptional regulator of viral defense system
MSFTSSWIDALAARGKSVFTLADAAQAAGGTRAAAKLSIQHAVRAGALFSPARGLWVIVPVEYRTEGVAPWRTFIDPMLRREGRSYYVGLLTAASEHGASGQAAQEVQVVTDRPRAAIVAGRMRIAFITRRAAARAPVTATNAPTGPIPVSTPEMTALDLVAYPRHAGGWSNVATVVADLLDEMTADGVAQLLALPPATSDIQRLGFLLERLGAPADLSAPLEPWLRARPSTFIPLDPRSGRVGDRDSRWRVIENVATELD